MKAAVIVLLVAATSCTVDPEPCCKVCATVGVALELPAVTTGHPAFAAADLTLYGTTDRGHQIVDQLYIAGIAATSTRGNFDSFTVIIPKGRLLQLRNSADGTVAVDARVETACSDEAHTITVATLAIASGPPLLVPPSGTLVAGERFDVTVQFDPAEIGKACTLTRVAGIQVSGNGVDLAAVDAPPSVEPRSGRIDFRITQTDAAVRAPIQIVCTDKLGQQTIGKYEPLPPPK